MIVGLAGRIGAGKNTTAERLAVLYDGSVVEVSFAAKMKESLAVLFGVSVADIELLKNDPAARVALGGIFDGLGFVAEKHRQQTLRRFMQIFGTVLRETLGEDIWVDAALPLDIDLDEDTVYVVTDVRFANEVERLGHLGGYVVLVVGPDAPADDHESERLDFSVDATITNVVRDDGFAALDAELRRVLPGIAGRDA